MTGEEKFNEIIRSKFSEKEFLFDEGNWEKAEAMLDSAARRKSGIKWSAVFLMGIFAGVVVMLPFVMNVNDESSNNITELSPQQKYTNEIADRNKENYSEEKVISQSNSNPQFENIVSQLEIKEEKLFRQETPKNSSVASAHNTQPAIAPEEKIVASSESNEKTNSVKEENMLSGRESKVIANTISIQKKQISKNEFKDTKVAEDVSQNTFSNNTIAGGNPNRQKADTPFIETENISSSSAKSTPFDTLSIQTQSSDQIVANQPETKKDIPAGQTDTQADSSAVASSSANPAAPLPKVQSLSSATIFSVDAGANFIMGWHYDITEARGFNPVFGIGISHYFNPQWVLSSGIRYESIAHLKASQKTFSSANFDFGYNAIDTVVDTKLLHYVVLPVQFQYCFDTKNTIGIGGSVSYLVNTTSNVVAYSKNSFGSTDMNQKKQFGFMNGFNKWDASLAISYRRRISEKFSISASANYGLLDIKENTFFSREHFERNIGLKILFRYDLFQY